MIVIREYQKQSSIEIHEYQENNMLRQQFIEVLKEVDQDFLPPLSKRRTLDFWLELFEKGIIIYAQEDDRVAGFIVYYPALKNQILQDLQSCVNVDPVLNIPNSDEIFQGAYMHFIAISPEFRGRNIASDLMVELNESMMKRGITSLRVITWSTNIKSINLYKKHGYFIYKRNPDPRRGEGVESVYLEVKLPLNQSLKEENL